MTKDIAMAEVATQFIGKSAASQETPSSTRNYEQAWGERSNTGVYTPEDVVMVSGSGPWRGVTPAQIESTFQTHYVPLLERAIEAGSSFLVGNAKGTDELVQNYLAQNGYKLENTAEGYTKCSPVIQNLQFSNNNAPPSLAVNPSASATALASLPTQSTSPHRPDWERKLITVALRNLDTNPANATAETKVASVGGRYAVVYTTQDETLQILDATGSRGTLYKARKGQSAEISNFSEQEKAAFLTQSAANTRSKASRER
jgi:hypothetical protein